MTDASVAIRSGILPLEEVPLFYKESYLGGYLATIVTTALVYDSGKTPIAKCPFSFLIRRFLVCTFYKEVRKIINSSVPGYEHSGILHTISPNMLLLGQTSKYDRLSSFYIYLQVEYV